MNTPKVSVIIPVYNVEKYLKQCLDSIINQTYKNIEIICINDGSTDKSLQVIKEYQIEDTRIILIDLIKNNGVSNARNEGLKAAKGNYVAFIDADDYIEYNYIEKLLKPNADIVVCSFYKEYSFKSEKNIITGKEKLITKDDFIKDLLNFQKALGCVWGKLFNVKYLKKHTILFDEKLILAEDAEFCLKTIQYNPTIVYIPDILYHYNFSSNSAVRTFNKNYCINYKNSLYKMSNFIDKTKHLIQWNNFVAHHLILICINYCFNLHNKVLYNKKKQMLEEILKDNLFLNGLNLSKIKDFPLTKKIALFCLKNRLYFIVYIISVIRNKTR